MPFTAEQRAKAAETRRLKAEARAQAPAPAAALPDDVLMLIRDLSDQVKELKAQVAQKAANVPSMIPMGAGDLPNPREMFQGIEKGESRDGGRQLPVGARGLELDPSVYVRYQQAFVPGQRVRINPAAHRDGWAEGRTWADVLAQSGPFLCQTKVGKTSCRTQVQANEACPRCGAAPVVKGVRYLSKAGEWKYIVRVPGITQRNGLGDGFAQSELLPV